MNVRVLETVYAELAEAIAHHKKESESLGAEFKRAANLAFDNMIAQPMLSQKFSGEYRRRRTKKFRYGFVYRIGPEELVIVAFMHLRRRPGYWKRRDRP
jgi:hypothetical protein